MQMARPHLLGLYLRALLERVSAPGVSLGKELDAQSMSCTPLG